MTALNFAQSKNCFRFLKNGQYGRTFFIIRACKLLWHNYWLHMVHALHVPCIRIYCTSFSCACMTPQFVMFCPVFRWQFLSEQQFTFHNNIIWHHLRSLRSDTRLFLCHVNPCVILSLFPQELGHGLKILFWGLVASSPLTLSLYWPHRLLSVY